VKLGRAPTYGSFLYAPVAPMFGRLMRRIVREFEPDVVHVHMPNTSALGAAKLSVPLVVHWHSDVVPSRIDKRLALAYRFYKPFESRMLARAAAVVATSQPYLDSSETLKPYRDKCAVVPLGIDPARLPEPDEASRQWARQQWHGDGLRVLTVGRLTYYKGHAHLIDAMKKTSEARLCIVGDGDLHKRLQWQVTQGQLHDRVRLLGYVDDAKVRALLAECDCFCLPSVERTEAFGVVLMEAMRYSKPLVATRIPGSGVGWVVNHNVTGLLVEPGDSKALAGALNQLAGDVVMQERFGAAGRDRFLAEFHIDSVAKALLRLYGRIG
jgi:rhamnosyl/mannosyltransferase